jgi:hypothetical protein
VFIANILMRDYPSLFAGESVPADALMFEAPGHDRTQLRALDGRLHSGDDSSASAKG